MFKKSSHLQFPQESLRQPQPTLLDIEQQKSKIPRFPCLVGIIGIDGIAGNVGISGIAGIVGKPVVSLQQSLLLHPE